MPGRHRHAVDVRSDGLAAVLGRLLHHPGVRSAALVDVDSGMLLDGWVATPGTGPDPEVLGAGHAELVRVALGILPAVPPGAPGGEIVLDAGAAGQHVLRVVPDPHGDRLALSVVVTGPRWAVARVRRRLRRVSAAALTAGPSAERRPGDAVWSLRAPAGPVLRRSWWTRPASGDAPVPAPPPGPSGVDLFSAPGPPPASRATARGHAALGRSAPGGPPDGPSRPAPASGPVGVPSTAPDPAAADPDGSAPARSDTSAGPAMALLGPDPRVLPRAAEAVERLTGGLLPAVVPAPRAGTGGTGRDPDRPLLVALPGGAAADPDPRDLDSRDPDPRDPDPRGPDRDHPARGRAGVARSPAPPSALPPGPHRGPTR